jgi:hypothetical protein
MFTFIDQIGVKFSLVKILASASGIVTSDLRNEAVCAAHRPSSTDTLIDSHCTLAFSICFLKNQTLDFLTYFRFTAVARYSSYGKS